MRSCEILVNKIKAGILREEDNGTFEFRYDKEYLKRENAKPVSLTLPLREEPYYSPYLFPAFSNMLTEGENRKIQAYLFGLNPEDDFGIMLESCTFDVIGAITVNPLVK